jgi:hypothetical protein
VILPDCSAKRPVVVRLWRFLAATPSVAFDWQNMPPAVPQQHFKEQAPSVRRPVRHSFNEGGSLGEGGLVAP